MTVVIFIGITKASDLNTVIMKNDNSFIHKRGTRWQERAHTSKDLRHIDERWGAYHKGVQSQSGRLVLREGKNELTRAGTCTTETWWSCDERSSSGQRQDLRLCYLREQNLGNRECHVKKQQAVTRLGLEEEMLSGQAQERYWIISNRIDEQRYEKVRSEQELLKMEEWKIWKWKT